MRFGVHVSIAGGLEKAVERAAELGCDCFQIFVANPRSWQPRPLKDDEAKQFITSRKSSGLGPVVVHLTYLPNLASPDEERLRQSRESFLQQYRDAATIDADLFVIHPGAYKEGTKDDALKRIADSLAEVLQKANNGPKMLLENMAGAGSQLGGEIDELATVAKYISDPKMVGICFDTAHAAAAGIDLSVPDTMRKIRQQYRRAFGYHPINLIHMNDLRSKTGSKRDRHEHIGKGSVGKSGFSDLFSTPGMKKMPFILETPIDETRNDRDNLAEARRLAGILQ